MLFVFVLLHAREAIITDSPRSLSVFCVVCLFGRLSTSEYVCCSRHCARVTVLFGIRLHPRSRGRGDPYCWQISCAFYFVFHFFDFSTTDLNYFNPKPLQFLANMVPWLLKQAFRLLFFGTLKSELNHFS
ncbi:hypothetical protein L596_001227 [Steinernema carpocapsae]|uniref:Secreted protein n=1 Tax=Steinernema carpocapsae TaxID=34508 RepID=A0A4V6I7C1_STECR|nr:hypothetical protein L596_001227 [Steinernema carpocapsae]